jgi:hypothetical protein
MGNPVGLKVRQLGLRGLLAAPSVRRRALGIVSGVGLRYDPPAGSGPDAGRRAEGVPGVNGAALAAALRRGWFTLVSTDEAVHDVAAAAEIGVARVSAAGPQWTLVRPDGYVADRGHSADELRASLARWGLVNS